jgi:PAS domain S-box-containing protein
VARWWTLAYPDEAYREGIRREWMWRMEDAVTRKGSIAPMEALVTCADGTVRHIQFHSSSIGERNIVTFIDLTAQKATEHALRKEEQEKSVVLNSMSDLVVYQDRDMRVIWANHAAGVSVGQTGASLAGRQCYELWGQRHDPCEECPVVMAIETGQPRDAEVITPDGRIWHVRGFPVRDGQGQVEGVVEFVTDITERKWAEQRQLELTIERERANIMQRFIGDASHDLRTPLTTIKAHLYLLEKVDLSANSARYVGEITRQVARLEKLLDDMLSMSRLDAALAFDLECVDLNTLVRGVVDQYNALARDKRHTLRFEGAGDLPQVPVDPVHLRRAVSNLLVNALHYTPGGGEITVTIAHDQEWVQIEVRDNGIGIGEDDLPHIFKRFYRADKARSTVSGGAGLGLTIARRIVDGHKGRIEVDTTPGQGSTFRIVLPMGTCEV